MAAPGGRSEVRVRLTFEYPPPALPHSRHLWFMLDIEQCRAVTDVSAMIQERFFYSRRGALSLYLDGSLLPPGESVRLIRDNDAISVKWEGSRPRDSPQPSRKRQRSENESDDCRDLHGDAPEDWEEEEEEHRDRIKKKKRKKRVTLEQEMNQRPKKKLVTPELEVNERSKKKKRGVTPEEENVSIRPKKKEKKREVEEELNKRPKKREEVHEQPKKKKNLELTSEEEVVSERPQKKKVVTLEEEEVSERPQKKKVVPLEEEVVSERPQKKKVVPLEEEEVSERLKKKVIVPQQDDEGGFGKKLKKRDLSKEPGTNASPRVALYQGKTPPLNSTVQKSPPLNSTVQKKSPPLNSTVQKKAPPMRNTSRKEASSSSSDSEDAGGQGRSAEPGPPLRMQQRSGSSSMENDILKKPHNSSLTTSPVCNGRLAGAGAQQSPLLKTAVCGLGRGRGLDYLPPRGRGFRGQGESRLQSHFFYNYSPEAIKEQQLKEDVSNVSVLIQNPPEVRKRDYSALPLLSAPPPPGQIIAFKLLELTENYTPEVSDYKEGRVLNYDPVSQKLELEVLSRQKKKEPGKFDLVYEGVDGIDIVEYAVPQERKISQAWSSIIEPRLVTEHGPQEHLSAVTPGP